MKINIHISFLLFASLSVLVSCAGRKQPPATPFTTSCADLEARLKSAWLALEELNSGPRPCVSKGLSDPCESARREIERISQQCPQSYPAILASSILAYERGERVEAQQSLDRLLATGAAYPDAAALRGRLALDEGNVPFALRFLEQQIHVSPADSRLHEMFASALYFDRRWTEAAEQLEMAERLGAPKWRILYHFGLLKEANGAAREAMEFYEKALVEKPEWALAKSRLKGLQSAAQTTK